MIRRFHILYMFLAFATLFLIIFHNPIVAEFQVRVSTNTIGHLELQYWRKMASYSVNNKPPVDHINFVSLGLLIVGAISSLLAILYSRNIKYQSLFIVITFGLVLSDIVVSVINYVNVKYDLGSTIIDSVVNVNFIWLILVWVFSFLSLIKTFKTSLK